MSFASSVDKYSGVSLETRHALPYPHLSRSAGDVIGHPTTLQQYTHRLLLLAQ